MFEFNGIRGGWVIKIVIVYLWNLESLVHIPFSLSLHSANLYCLPVCVSRSVVSDSL